MTFEKPQRDYHALLNPDELRTSLILVALYVLAYESFRDGAIDHVHTLYWCGIDESGHKYNEEEYRREILSRNRSPFRACLSWYREMNALDDADLASIETLTQTRNRLVHDLMSLLGTEKLNPDLLNLQELLRIYRKLEVWRVINLELEFDEEWRDKDIDEGDVMPGSIIMMRMLMDVALGKDDDAWAYYREFMKADAPNQRHDKESDERAT